MARANVLNAESLSSLIASSLPKDASPQLKSPLDAIAIACHAGMLAVGFRLVGLGEDHTIEAFASPDDARPLPAEWNAATSHAFRYKHSQSSMEYLLKATRLGNKTIVHGLAMGDDKPASFNLTTADFISGSSLPATPFPAATAQEDAKHAITTIFISPSRLTDLGADLRTNILQKLIPSLQKEGYEEQSSSTRTSTQQQEPSRTQDPVRPPIQPARDPNFDPLRDYGPRPARPHNPIPPGDFPPPGFEDEYEILRPPRGAPPPPGAGIGGMPAYGERDLYPAGLGPNDPFRPGGVGPPLRGGPGGGMHPTFDDPLFRGQGGGDGYGYDMQVPPGARYDPVGPGGRPPRGSGGWPRGGGGGAGGMPPNPFGGYGSGDFI